MYPKIRIINGQYYVPISKKTYNILKQTKNTKFYKIGNLKTLFIKVNYKKEI